MYPQRTFTTFEEFGLKRGLAMSGLFKTKECLRRNESVGQIIQNIKQQEHCPVLWNSNGTVHPKMEILSSFTDP